MKLNNLVDAKSKLKKTETRSGEMNIEKYIETEPQESASEVIRDYFFSSGVDEWYNELKKVNI